MNIPSLLIVLFDNADLKQDKGEKNEQQWKNTKSKFLYKISPE